MMPGRIRPLLPALSLTALPVLSALSLTALLVLPSLLGSQERRPSSAGARATASRTIAGRDPLVIRAEYAAVLLQAERYSDAAHEYRTLLAADSTNAEWRLGLARAYAWGERPRDAERELLRLLAIPRPDTAVRPLLRAVRVSMRVSPAEAVTWLSEEPDHRPYRLALARALVRDDQVARALPHYDALLAVEPNAELMREAGAARFAAGDTLGAIGLVERSLVLDRSVAGHLLLGDLWRWRGDTARARMAYEAARLVDADDPGVATALARLTREARPPLVVAGPRMEAPGWTSRAGFVGDNTGVGYATLALRRGASLGARLGGEVWIGGGAELRRLEQRRTETSVHGLALDAGVEYERWFGSMGARVSARGGTALHERTSVAPMGALAAAIWVSAWELSWALEAGPAYTDLLTIESIVEPDPRGGGPLGATRMSAAITGPLGPADLALAIEQMDLADGNVRESVHGSVRYALRPRVAALYAMGTVQADSWSALYWSPVTFMSHSVGIETAERTERGLSYAVRALVGGALSEEYILTGPSGARTPELTRGVAPQLSVSGELAWRGSTWEIAGGAGYGRGRDGGYERASANLTVRLLP